MRYLTKEWYILHQTYPMPQKLKKKLEGISEACREAKGKEALSDELRRNFSFHDGTVLALTTGKDCVMQIDSPFSGYHTITFLDAIVKQEIPPVGAWWIYEELYRHKSGAGYEAHILFQKLSGRSIQESDLFDMKIVCKDILFQ